MVGVNDSETTLAYYDTETITAVIFLDTKDNSLLRYGNNYGCKTFYSTRFRFL